MRGRSLLRPPSHRAAARPSSNPSDQAARFESPAPGSSCRKPARSHWPPERRQPARQRPHQRREPERMVDEVRPAGQQDAAGHVMALQRRDRSDDKKSDPDPKGDAVPVALNERRFWDVWPVGLWALPHTPVFPVPTGGQQPQRPQPSLARPARWGCCRRDQAPDAGRRAAARALGRSRCRRTRAQPALNTFQLKISVRFRLAPCHAVDLLSQSIQPLRRQLGSVLRYALTAWHAT